jgi:hypothetical protein
MDNVAEIDKRAVTDKEVAANGFVHEFGYKEMSR